MSKAYLKHNFFLTNLVLLSHERNADSNSCPGDVKTRLSTETSLSDRGDS